MTAETYERVTRVPGSYARCREGIDRLLARGVRVKLKTMALAWNAHEIPAMREFARSLGCEFQHDGILNARVDCGANRTGELRLSAERMVALDLDDPTRAAQLKEACEEALAAPVLAEGGAIAYPGGDHVYSCGAGRNTFTVDPYGSLQLCQLSRRNGYDLRGGTFRAGWDEHLPRLRERRWRANSVCRSCSLISLCASCAGAAELEHGDPEAVVAQFCEITHRRTFALSANVPGHLPDASCCLEAAARAAASMTAADADAGEAGCGGGGCGCGDAAAVAGPQAPLIQIGRRAAPRTA
jgi:radical SAM protein with 4Fe4S-binding SPASM domain